MQRGALPVPPARNRGGKLSVGLTLRFPDMTKEEIETIVAAFQKFDLDGNGRLDKQEFALVMEEVKKTNKGKGAADRMLMDLHFDAMDKDHSGGIDIEEFIAGYNSLFHEERHELALKLHAQHPDMEVHQIERVLKAFEKFDKDGDGVLDAEEFYQLKEELLPEVSKVLLRLHSEKRFSHADDDGSGDLNRVELVAAYREIFGSQSGLSPRVGNIPINAQKAFEDFATCDTLLATRQRFNELKETCEAAEGSDVYEAVRGHLLGHPRWKPFFQLLDKLRKQKEYTIKSTNKPRVLIVGAGPGGLRMAIEAALLGARVTVLEKRSKFSRHNLLHVWDSSIRDLKNIGAKYFYAQLCTGGIKKLQLVLLKIGLLLGVNFVIGTYSSCQQSGALWKADVTTSEKHSDDDFLFNVLIGAEGANSGISREFEFEKKTFKGSDAIGITANFVNTQTPDEKKLAEFGLLSIYNQPFFNKFKEVHDIELENLVYYRGETHYFVMTAKRPSLLRKGVLKEDRPVETLFAPDNMDRAKLEEFVRQVATLTGLPAQCDWVKSKRGVNDVAIFDFSKKQQCTSPAKIVHGTNGARLLVGMVGDALVEPFWPQGTGANRAFLSCYDLAWAIKGLFERGTSAADEAKLLAEWNSDYKTMSTASPADLNTNMGAFTIDPRTRYKKTSVGHLH